jgi:hypothetical protein
LENSCKSRQTIQHRPTPFSLSSWFFFSLTAISFLSCVEPSSRGSYIERTASRAYGWNIAIHPHQRYKYTPDTFYIYFSSLVFRTAVLWW